MANPAQRGIWQFTSPQAINENGCIVGWGCVNGNNGRGFILAPHFQQA